jgi:hypothetical protein
MGRYLIVAVVTGLAMAGLAGCKESKPAAPAPPPATAQATVAPAPPVPAEPVLKDVMKFAHVAPIGADLELKKVGDSWHVTLLGGADQRDGAAVAADCELRGEGALVGGKIEAVLVPFEGDITSVTADDVKEHPGKIIVTFGDGAAKVDVTEYLVCSGSHFDGSYKAK